MEDVLNKTKPVAWRRATKYGWEYRSTEPTEKIKAREPGWLPLYSEPMPLPPNE